YLIWGYGKKVLLVDNHAQLGHVALYLGMDGSQHHFYDLVQNVSRLDHDFVLLDCEASFEDISLAIIALSNCIYLIATPEIGAIRDLSRYVDGLIQNEQATRKLQVVINRYSSHEAVTIEQIEKAVHLPIAFKIPNNYGEL